MKIKRFEAPDIKAALAMIKKELGESAVILSTKKIEADGGKWVLGKKQAGVEVLAVMDHDLEALVEPAAPQEPSQEREQFAPDKIEIRTVHRDQQVEDIRIESQDLKVRFANLLHNQTGKVRPVTDEAKGGQPVVDGSASDQTTPADNVAAWRDKLLTQVHARRIPVGMDNQATVVMALVGATGVGKTTTAVKLAAWYGLREGRKVALLSMDCYRIGATDQLRAYARIMKIPCEIALRKKDLDEALVRHRNKDLIIVDTAGRSPYDQQHIAELKDWFDQRKGLEPLLVLSATTRKENMAQVIEAYRGLAVSGMVLTKLDETRSYATLCQQVAMANLPVSFLCTGQRIPEDFLVASKERLNNLFTQGWPSVVRELEKL